MPSSNSAFTYRYASITRTPKSGIYILNDDGSIVHSGVALWDTGAMVSCIDDELARSLCMDIIDTDTIHGPGGSDDVNIYAVYVELPNNMRIHGKLRGIRQKLNWDILIGMDLISRGDFAITNQGGKSMMSFCLPTRKSIDFVQELAEGPKVPIKQKDPCWCGSEKKYKYCHGKRV